LREEEKVPMTACDEEEYDEEEQMYR